MDVMKPKDSFDYQTSEEDQYVLPVELSDIERLTTVMNTRKVICCLKILVTYCYVFILLYILTYFILVVFWEAPIRIHDPSRTEITVEINSLLFIFLCIFDVYIFLNLWHAFQS